MKKAFDILFSIVGLICLSPLFVVVAIVIKITMPGPVFFKQMRIGYLGKPFTIYKFRSMVINKSSVSVTLKSDRRITPFGSFLRNSKIDEFPQLWNILIGDMSFVGPRPDVPGYADQLEGEEKIILSVKPGLTGLDSVKYPDEEEILHDQKDPEKFYDEVLYPDKVRININYIEHKSFMLDLRIIVNTLLGRKFKEDWLN